jgi:2-C-methyl-D-erythritol 4-phosphate cytidylyltransferase
MKVLAKTWRSHETDCTGATQREVSRMDGLSTSLLPVEAFLEISLVTALTDSTAYLLIHDYVRPCLKEHKRESCGSGKFRG